MTLKELRTSRRLSQKEAANSLGVSLRSYITYENDSSKTGTIKYRYFFNELEKINRIDEENGILDLDDIRGICAEIFDRYEVDYCYLFGSYAKGQANGRSDVDLLVASRASGIKHFEMVEMLREKLHKKVDVLDEKQLTSNEVLLNEVLKDGIKIYG